ncbi:DUF2306 domain-containing protein [Aliihoeflea sp. PC F10.4]
MSAVTLLDAPLAVQFHVATVVPAAILGAWLLARPKGTRSHRTLGKIWMGLMLVTSLSTFFIHEIRLVGDFSPIHLISIYVIVSCFTAVRAARRHNITAHRRMVAGMYLGGIVIAGAFTFLPGRIMSTSLISLASGSGSIVLVAALAFAFIAAGMLAIREMGFGKKRAA